MPEPVQAFIRSLPFELTAGQRGGLDDAMADVASGARPMSRLLQGDVGSGKTVVALAMLLTAVAAGHQGAIMAPTEVLAEQHFLSVRRLLSAAPQPVWEQDWFSIYLDGHRRPISIGLLTGSTRAAPRREILRMAVEGTLDILIGTHALIQSGVEMPDLALAVVDEQHRFGVLQRAAIRKQNAPHLLLMSATPIPRTLALTLYGDLDVSVMPDLPAGRREITTRIVPPARAGRRRAFPRAGRPPRGVNRSSSARSSTSPRPYSQRPRRSSTTGCGRRCCRICASGSSTAVWGSERSRR